MFRRGGPQAALSVTEAEGCEAWALALPGSGARGLREGGGLEIRGPGLLFAFVLQTLAIFVLKRCRRRTFLGRCGLSGRSVAIVVWLGCSNSGRFDQDADGHRH